jgi:PTS system mannose-specific IIA component
MIGLVLVTHAGLATELLVAAEMIVGVIDQAEVVGIRPEMKAETVMEAIAAAVEKVSADGVIIMTDMFGGTPSNMSLSFLEENRVEVLTGVNLPMVIQFVSDRGRLAVTDLACKLKKTGIEGISVAGDYLKK